jgi:hypothetical protein
VGCATRSKVQNTPVQKTTAPALSNSQFSIFSFQFSIPGHPLFAAALRLAMVLFFAFVWAFPAAAADWRDTLSPPTPGRFPQPRPLKAVYRFGWSGVTAAEAKFDLSRSAHGQYRLSMNTQTIGFARSLWQMDSQHSAVCQAATLRPIRLQQTEKYKNETETTEAVFTADEVRRQTHVTPLKGPQEKEKRFKFPNVFDLQSGLLYVRSQRMTVGDHYRFVVYPSTSPYLADIEVLGREKLKAAGTTYNAIKCQVRLQGISKKLELTPHKKFKRALAWMSDDRDRLLLRIEAEVFVGSVWAELQSAEFDPKP